MATAAATVVVFVVLFPYFPFHTSLKHCRAGRGHFMQAFLFLVGVLFLEWVWNCCPSAIIQGASCCQLFSVHHTNALCKAPQSCRTAGTSLNSCSCPCLRLSPTRRAAQEKQTREGSCSWHLCQCYGSKLTHAGRGWENALTTPY